MRQVLLFDIDGTLLNTGGAGQQAMELALQTVCGVTRPTHGVSAAGRTDRAIITDLFAYHGIASSPEVWTAFQAAYFDHLAQVLPTLPGRMLPGVVDLLESLHSRDDLLLGLLTGNFQRGASLKLGHYKINHYFHCGGFGDEHHDRDDVARAALNDVIRHQRSAVDAEQLWVIGDTPFDVRCGRAIGARVVAVATGSFSREQLAESAPDHLLDSLEDAASIESWF
ncbi:MAG: HAD hydrolase-like protein [Planctomycetaceae bacterium]|nr:HAD hydrolase-like protein [Planctomycetaceae bacterium]